jgi:hypothetical protein
MLLVDVVLQKEAKSPVPGTGQASVLYQLHLGARVAPGSRLGFDQSPRHFPCEWKKYTIVRQ